MAEWSYQTMEQWATQFPISVEGQRQSPIDITNDKVTQEAFEALKIVKSVKSGPWVFENNGKTIKGIPSEEKWTLSGGNLPGSYVLDSFHIHWGMEAGKGSEHLVDGVSYDGEAHFVFKWDDSQGEAPEDSHVAVGVLLKEKDPKDKKKGLGKDTQSNHLEKSLKPIEGLKVPGKMNAKVQFDIERIFPIGKSEYWIYKGSLTTPPFAECVLHLLFCEPVLVSKDFMTALRGLTTKDGASVGPNFRTPVLDQGERVVHKSK